MFDPVAGTEPRENLRLLVEMIGGNDNGDRLTDNFIRFVTEDTFRALVPARDAASKLADPLKEA